MLKKDNDVKILGITLKCIEKLHNINVACFDLMYEPHKSIGLNGLKICYNMQIEVITTLYS